MHNPFVMANVTTLFWVSLGLMLVICPLITLAYEAKWHLALRALACVALTLAGMASALCLIVTGVILSWQLP